MLKIAVCDDEEPVLLQTKKMLLEYKQKCEVDLYQSGEDLLTASEQYDMILLDIDMNGMNGIETAKKIREKDKKVQLLYVTNYSDYTIFAFAVHAFAYLLKPLNKKDLFAQLDEALSYGIGKEEAVLDFETTDGVIHLKPSEIIYFEYQSREVILKSDKKSWHLKMKISEIADRMKAYDCEMPHKSFVVNLGAVVSVRGYDLHMSDGSCLPLSQKKSVAFRKELNEYLAGRKGRL